MKLTLEHGKLYVDNVKFSKYEVCDGTINPGTYRAEARYSHTFGKVLPHLDGIGWIGADIGVAIVVGSVRSSRGLLPDGHLVRVLVEKIDEAFDMDMQVLAEVK